MNMTLATTTSSRRRILNQLLAQANNWAFKESYHPDTWDETDANYLLAINKMERLLDLHETKELKP